MRSAAQNLRKAAAAAVAVNGKSRAALFRGFCSPFCSSSSPPRVLQLSDHITAADGGPALAASTTTPTPPPNLPPPFDQNVAGGAPGMEGLDDITRPPTLTPEDIWHWRAPCGRLVNYLKSAWSSEAMSLADYCVQQISQIQDSQYKLVKIVKADCVTVAGLRIWITLELSNQDGQLRKYRFEVWERPWLKLRELLSWGPVD